MAPGDFALIDPTPQMGGYRANLARTFVLGEPDARQANLLAAYGAYGASVEAARETMRPGATVADLDAAAGAVYARHDLAEYQVNGIGHGIGLRFEERPASTIIPPHRSVPLESG